LSSFI